MKYPNDITGLKFGKLTVQSYSYKDTNNKTYWSCLCDCGNTKIIRRNCLVSNTTLSCGCLKQEASNKRHNSLIGQVFDRLTVIELSEQKNNKRSRKWLCKCTCGNNTIVGTTELNNKKVRSCGCLRSELHKELAIKRNYIHGECTRDNTTKEWFIWSSIIQRCTNPNNKHYDSYGGRGIIICDRWKDSYTNFLEDMGRVPFKEASIDRIDVNGNYNKENCRWTDAKTQANNKRNNKIVTINSKTQTLALWSDELNINYQTLYYRLKHNLDLITGVKLNK